MPQVTVYIRTEDYQQWKDIQQKSEFIHNALNGSSSKGSASTVGTTRTAGFEPVNLGSNPSEPAIPPVEVNTEGSLGVRPPMFSSKKDVRFCPHGYGVGMCKKADCNKKYAKL